MKNNAYFKTTDTRVTSIAGYPLHPEWWSRGYEYPWALSFARGGDVVADMGCGWSPRPLKEALATIVGKVYAVDHDERVFGLKVPENVHLIQADITSPISAINDHSLDKIFCVSVLEDLGDMVAPALKEFARVVKPNGRIIITFDVKHDRDAKSGPYPGVNLTNFMGYVLDAGLRFDGAVSLDKGNIVTHSAWNLCVYHCVLKP